MTIRPDSRIAVRLWSCSIWRAAEIRQQLRALRRGHGRPARQCRPRASRLTEFGPPHCDFAAALPPKGRSSRRTVRRRSCDDQGRGTKAAFIAVPSRRFPGRVDASTALQMHEQSEIAAVSSRRCVRPGRSFALPPASFCCASSHRAPPDNPVGRNAQGFLGDAGSLRPAGARCTPVPGRYLDLLGDFGSSTARPVPGTCSDA